MDLRVLVVRHPREEDLEEVEEEAGTEKQSAMLVERLDICLGIFQEIRLQIREM